MTKDTKPCPFGCKQNWRKRRVGWSQIRYDESEKDERFLNSILT